MPPTYAPITFVIPGISSDGAPRGDRAELPPSDGETTRSVTVTTQRGGGDPNIRLSAVPGEDMVVLDIADGPSLWLHPESARELLQSQITSPPARGEAAPIAAGEVAVPARLQWRQDDVVPVPGATRGSFLGGVGIQAFHLVTGWVKGKAADITAETIAEMIDSQVKAGVYQLQPDTLGSLKDRLTSDIAASDGISLVLIHGTFSSTSGTFVKLWNEHPDLVDRLFKCYDNRVYALDHPTVGAGPIANAITLAKAVPRDARLHLLTHSRGGLVAEVLARVCARPDAAADGTDDTIELKQLAKLVKERNITVERVVRVACPARGTLFASWRLDAYISVLKWALRLAQIPVAPEMIDFLGAVARKRADLSIAPGLAAQIPGSALVNWLNTADDRIKGDLRVVAGELQGDSVLSWVKVLLADTLFWSNNDLVVHTASMYGGSPRDTDSTFLLDQGGKVTHFAYFSNALTATAIVNALTRMDGASPDGFNVIGPRSWAGEDASGIRAALPTRSAAKAAELPALFLLPGLLGSNLKVGDDRIWLGWRLINGFNRLAYPDKSKVLPDGPIGMYYDDLATALFEDHDVRPFAFDWRRPIREEARRLAAAIDDALDARSTSKQPVRIIAHSMGGVVARVMQLEKPATWNRMMKSDGARLLMLGTPNGGSWSPMQVLSGDDTFGNLLMGVGTPFSGNATRQLIANFPGFIQLQAGLLEGLGKVGDWKELEKADLDAIRARSLWHSSPLQLKQFEWGIPSQTVLNEAADLRRALDKQRDKDLVRFADKLLLVVGKAASTPAGYVRPDTNNKEFVYLDGDRGDGRVTLENAVLPGVATWIVDADHGSLPRHRVAFEGYRDLLKTGTTKQLAPLTAAGTSRGLAAQASGPLTRSRPARLSSSALPPRRQVDVLSSVTTFAPQAAPPAAALRIRVVNGDLTYVSDPLLIGHYRSLRLSGAEKVMNYATNGLMSASLRRGLYPSAPGTHQVFTNVEHNPENLGQPARPPTVIVAGLGPEGELRGSDLVNTVRLSVIAWAQHLMESGDIPTGFTLATTLLGSGGTGVTAWQAAQLIAQGVREANDQLEADNDPPRWPRVEQLNIIELYLDRASEAWNALQALAESTPALYMVSPTIARTAGALRRPPEVGYRGADYDFISALATKKEGDTLEISYTLDSKRARNEVRPQPMQIKLIENLVETASNNTNTDAQIGRTLFTLLVPADLEAFLGGSTETVLELEPATAAIPWEILESPALSSNSKPWSIRAKVLRKMRVTVPTIAVNGATADDGILVIGDPASDRKKYPVLLGARREAENVAKCLAAATSEPSEGRRPAATRVTTVISGPRAGDPEPDLAEVINASFRKAWRIIHIAGHGEPPREIGSTFETRGVVLSNDAFLGAQEIMQLRVKPELVFVNCCHLASDGMSPLREITDYNRAQFAAGVALALISSGVRCVVAAGWAIDDEAASVFATAFYAELLSGKQFIHAVAAAREKAYACGGNTWAAYQCYGDPDWEFRPATTDAQSPAPAPGQEFATIASATSLILTLEQIAVKSDYQHENPDTQAARLRFLDATFARYWGNRGDVSEAFGNAWSRLENFEQAVAWYERARQAEEGVASLASIEQLANSQSRLAWKRIAEEPHPSPAMFDQARHDILGAMTLLDKLIALVPTLERESLYGSCFKRLAMVETRANNAGAARDAIEKMSAHCSAAVEAARKTGANSFYPAVNLIVAELAIGNPVAVQELMALNKSISTGAQDFWSIVGQTELKMYEAIAGTELKDKVAGLIKEFRKHHARVDSRRMWGSVFDNATFVLEIYATRATPPEYSASSKLLGELKSLAGRVPSAAQPTATTAAATASNRRRAQKARPKAAKRVAKSKHGVKKKRRPRK